MQAVLEELFEEHFYVVFPVLWISVCIFLSRLSGWHQLAQKYPRIDFVSGEKWRFRSAKLRYSVGYNGCINFIANREGLGISIFFPFRVGHPPLFIRWTDIAISKDKQFFRNLIRFTVGSDFPIPILVHKSLGRKILEAAGQYRSPKDFGQQPITS
jgi:hypothetical protein